MSIIPLSQEGNEDQMEPSQAQDTVDHALVIPLNNNFTTDKPVMNKKVPSIEALNSEMPCKALQNKERGRRMLRTLLNRLRLRKCASVTISRPDPTYKVAYLGNVVTGWAKGDGCVEKPLATLWRNYTQSSRPEVRMQLTVSGGGLKATTKDHGLTEYWAHRLTTCAAPAQFPRLFCWVYRHEGRRLKHELRCHAVLCPTVAIAKQIESQLKHSLSLALAEFKRDKISRQNARLSLANCVYDNPTIPRRKILLSTGSQNYRPPLERSKSAPKLTSIEEILEEEEEPCEEKPNKNVYKKILRHYDSTSALLDKRKTYVRKLHHIYHPPDSFVPVRESGYCDVIDENCTEDHVGNNDNSKVKFSDISTSKGDSSSVEEQSDLILEELLQNSLKNDLLESCERAWFNALGEKPDLIPSLDSDEGSLSSGCESASTVTSDSDPPVFPTIAEISEDQTIDEPTSTLMNSSKPADNINNKRKTETPTTTTINADFKVGGCVLARVRSFERITNSDILKYCGLNTSSGLYCNSSNNNKSILGNEEVSLIPVGESQTDFSSLKVFKNKKNFNTTSSSSTEPGKEFGSFEQQNEQQIGDRDGNNEAEDDEGDFEIGENESACSDESGYEEEDIVSSVRSIVLV